jgi:plasmid stabilization system protein ParE
VNIRYSESARDDAIRQFRYYLVALNLPEIAIRFQEAVRKTALAIRERPYYTVRNPRLRNLRSWPVVGFPDIRIYFLVEEAIRVVRILHGRRDVKKILGQDKS